MSSQESIVHLNVGGKRFSTSRQTLTWPGDSFFVSLLSGRIGSMKDDKDAIFIDRDPLLFGIILNYLRTKQVDVRNVDIIALKHEAQFYGLNSLVKRLTLCDELDQCACGDVLFHGYLSAPAVPLPERPQSEGSAAHPYSHNRNLSEPPCLPSVNGRPIPPRGLPSMEAKFKLPPPTPPRPTIPAAAANDLASGSQDRPTGSVSADSDSFRQSSIRGKLVKSADADQLGNSLNRTAPSSGGLGFAGAYQNSVSFPPNDDSALGYSPDIQFGFVPLGECSGAVGSHGGANVPLHSAAAMFKKGHTRASSADFRPARTHQRNRNGSDLTRQIRQELTAAFRVQTCLSDPCRVRIIRGHHNWIAVGYCNFLCCYRMKDSIGWHLTWISPRMESSVAHLALSAKPGSQVEKMLAVALENHTIHLWALTEDGLDNKVGIFSLTVGVDTLFFIGSQLVALSQTGKVGIWHAMTQNWQVQDVVPISSYDTAGSFLLLGCTNGSIYYIDMQKFPLRMKDNDLLVTELYRDPHGDIITSISVYLTPKTSLCGNWIEIAYGTTAGAVRVIVQHPETVGHGPQLFQTFNVHRAPITKVALTTNHLISICSEYNHVRTWTVTRFRGMISTQPGSTPLASFKVLTLESADSSLDSDAADAGPFGEQDGEQVFIQKVVPETNLLYVRMASNGDRICSIRSVDGSSISSYLVHECEGSNRMGSRPRRYLFTGHSNGSIQMWDLTTAMDMYISNKEKPVIALPQGPSPKELLQLIDGCEVICSSISTTPSLTPASSFLHLPQAGGSHNGGKSRPY